MRTRKMKITGIVAFCTLVIVYTCFLGYLDIRDFERTIIAQTESHLSSLAQTHAETIRMFIWDIEEELKILAQDPRVQGAVVDNELHDSHSHNADYCPYEPLYNHLTSCVEYLLRIDSDGKVQGTVPFDQGLIGVSYSNKPGVCCVLEHREPCVSKVFQSHTGRKCIAIAYPVFKDEQLIGIV
jgi:hypothetical protein